MRLKPILALAVLFPSSFAGGATALQPALSLDEEVAQARQMQASSEAGYGEALRRSAAWLAREDRAPEAVQLLRELIADPETTFDRASALRQKAQYLLGQGRIEDALAAFEQQQALYDADPALLERFPAGYASSVMQQAEFLWVQGRVEEALQVNEKLLGPNRHRFSDRAVAGAMARKARMLHQSERTEEAVAAFDELFAAYPEYGVDDGMALSLRMTRAALQDPTRKSPQYIAALTELWNDPLFGDDPRILRVGLQLITAANLAGDAPGSLDKALRVLERIDAKSVDWVQASDFPARTRGHVRDAERTALSRLQSADAVGRADLAIFALHRLIVNESSEQNRQNLQRQMNRLVGLR